MALSRYLGNRGSDVLAELVANLIRVGKVTSVDPAAFTARVYFEDREAVESYDLRLIVPRSLKNKDFDVPDVGEHVVCLFLPTGVEAGFIVGSYYPSTEPRPDNNQDKTVRTFPDGTRFEYDRAESRFLLDNGPTKITADREVLRLECNGTYLELDAAGWRLNGPKGDLN